MDLAQIFITALFLPKDMASEIASVIIAARQRNQPRFSTSRVSKDDGDQESIDLLASKDHFHKHKFAHPSNSLPVMRRMTTYLSEVDWRVFHYLTEHFLQNGK